MFNMRKKIRKFSIFLYSKNKKLTAAKTSDDYVTSTNIYFYPGIRHPVRNTFGWAIPAVIYINVK